MNKLWLLLVLFCADVFCQKADTVEPVAFLNQEFVREIYNPYTKSTNVSYDYSGKWDFDADGKPDALYFIGNGGAHAYYYLRIGLSSRDVAEDFPFLEFDMPYPVEDVTQISSAQIVVADFDSDGITDMYLNLKTSDKNTLMRLRKHGIPSAQTIMKCAGGKIVFVGANR